MTNLIYSFQDNRPYQKIGVLFDNKLYFYKNPLAVEIGIDDFIPAILSWVIITLKYKLFIVIRVFKYFT